MKINAKEFLSKAKKETRAIGAFNVSSIECLKAVFEVAGQEGSPIIVETSKGESTHLIPELLFEMCNKLSEIFDVDYILHMDRCDNLDWMERCLKAGYNSISAEFGVEDYEKNIYFSKKARELTDKYDAQLEGVIDVVPLVYYEEKKTEDYTDPTEALRFVEDVACDSLVVSIGTQSGRLKTSEGLRMDILVKTNKLLPSIPFVLHGGSFLGKEVVQKAIENGVAKININSELRLAYTNKLKQNIKENQEEYAPYRLLKGVEDDMKKIIQEKIQMFNNYGK